MAIGWMRNPWTSIGKVPGHKQVGPRIASVIEHFLNTRPQIQEKIIAAIGAPKNTLKGPTKQEVH